MYTRVWPGQSVDSGEMFTRLAVPGHQGLSSIPALPGGARNSPLCLVQTWKFSPRASELPARVSGSRLKKQCSACVLYFLPDVWSAADGIGHWTAIRGRKSERRLDFSTPSSQAQDCRFEKMPSEKWGHLERKCLI